jgi:serine/threonine-protein kinase PknG
VQWYRGKIFLARGEAAADRARSEFGKVYFEMPGEIAPKLAIAFAAEAAGNLDEAASYFDRVARTDPGHTTACFGLARCFVKKGDVSGAAEALSRVPANHSLYIRARLAVARVLLGDENGIDGPTLLRAAQTLESVSMEGGAPHQLAARLLSCALRSMLSGKIGEDPSTVLLGRRLKISELRAGAEEEFRKAAHYAADREEKIFWVDLANAVRPVTFF